MIRYILKRFLLVIPVLLGATLLVFTIMEFTPGDPAKLIASSEKAKSILGWKPEHADLEEIIATAWKWHKNHPNGYAK